jgi:hypothetical protein
MMLLKLIAKPSAAASACPAVRAAARQVVRTAAGAFRVLIQWRSGIEVNTGGSWSVRARH